MATHGMLKHTTLLLFLHLNSCSFWTELSWQIQTAGGSVYHPSSNDKVMLSWCTQTVVWFRLAENGFSKKKMTSFDWRSAVMKPAWRFSHLWLLVLPCLREPDSVGSNIRSFFSAWKYRVNQRQQFDEVSEIRMKMSHNGVFRRKEHREQSWAQRDDGRDLR